MHGWYVRKKSWKSLPQVLIQFALHSVYCEVETAFFVLFMKILDFKGLNAVHTYLIIIGGNT
jgi:hypothetical protein